MKNFENILKNIENNSRFNKIESGVFETEDNKYVVIVNELIDQKVEAVVKRYVRSNFDDMDFANEKEFFDFIMKNIEETIATNYNIVVYEGIGIDDYLMIFDKENQTLNEDYRICF